MFWRLLAFLPTIISYLVSWLLTRHRLQRELESKRVTAFNRGRGVVSLTKELNRANGRIVTVRQELSQKDTEIERLNSRISLLEAEIESLAAWREREMARLDAETAIFASRGAVAVDRNEESGQ